ncbi:MAG: 3,4-dihydroxy-2-butanone-4-phosphate synthase [Euryarchaeota archaeon]|nr:3,4-dihydroxy-2-butanone-4-phosphate synthase [Euryarchaeota archaeon]MDE1837612.1 3,4-dihydroxy-2-butanone-4-phosphate synthase [Euryarchaeota archaeon]MDE1880804.1 3,4-dihydroxy-2-butanone-4-phosphate synthase [Euryarchaeota archaeon]MDE2045957.1 3,4-dihydroxy-2-butanone-4-phosphate synthase [Thermoplasmata archaeon]
MAGVARTHPLPRHGALSPRVELAARKLAAGEPVLVFDAPSREGETDLVQLAERVTPEAVERLRREAGGFICVTFPDELRRRLGLPFLSDLYRAQPDGQSVLPHLVPETFKYDRRSPFGILVNHRETYTGIPDADRALTIRALGQFVRDGPSLSDSELRERFLREFQAPGHVALLHPAAQLLRERRGHTELSGTLAELAGVPAALVLCEMLGRDGRALPPKAAEAVAKRHGWAFVEGEEIVEAWSRWSA